MNLKIDRKFITFVLLYFVTLLILLVDLLDNVPLTEQLRKIKYVYLVLLAFWYLLSIKNQAAKDRAIRKSNVVLFLCVLHTLLFGYIFVNDIVAVHTYVHARELLIYFLLVYLTLTYIYENKLLLHYATATYIALAIQLIYALFTNLQDLVNPLAYWRVFSNSLRYRSDFGFIAHGYTANYCVFALVASLLIYEILRREGKLKQYFKALLIMLVADIIILCIIASTAGRSGILTIIIIFIIYFGGEKILAMDKDKKRDIIITIVLLMTIVIAVMMVVGTFNDIWADSNRDHNISVNYPIFKELGNIWTGMGFVENSAFQAGRNNNWTSAFGVQTSSLDMYYVYLYFTTGIIGCILIGAAVIYMLRQLIKNINKTYVLFAFSLLIGWLFYAYWQCNLFTYRYFSPWFYLVVLLYIIDSTNNNDLENCDENRTEMQ